MNDKRHSNAFSSECAGIIAKVAKDVVGFKPGDRVFCPSFAKFGNYARERASSCQKLEETDSFEVKNMIGHKIMCETNVNRKWPRCLSLFAWQLMD